jgi:membrane fusion protein, adhesin transport system
MAVYEAEFHERTRGPSLIIWLVGAVVATFLVWAHFAALDEIVKAEGEVVSGSRPQIVQNLEGGILTELLVREGDAVEAGDVLARLRDTQFRATVDDLTAQLAAAEIRMLRLQAEIAGERDFIVPEDLAEMNPAILASERALLAARQADYQSRLDGAMMIVDETRRELAVMEDLYAREFAALIELSRARKANGDAEIRLNEILTSTDLERAAALSEVLLERDTLRQNLRLAQDQLARTVVTSPMAGIVNSVNVVTIGGVVRPGEEIFQIIPAGDTLYIEARVRPADIANVVAGAAGDDQAFGL